MHVGLIGGIGPTATVVYYPHIVSGFARVGQPLHLTIAHTSAATLSHNVSTGQAEPQAAEFARLTEQLAAAGADVVAITSMGATSAPTNLRPGRVCPSSMAHAPWPSI